MSDFFGGIYNGVRRPDVVMNDGPLPPLTIGAGYPAGFNGTPDGKIDYSSSLLGDLDPYAYGEAARLSTQAAYTNTAHVAQRIIPSLDLPEAQPFNMGGRFFRLSHQVDDGDVAFVIRAMFSPYELVPEKKKFNRQGVLFMIDPVVNLATVNYILHGLQRYGFDRVNHKCWNTLWMALGVDEHFGGSGNYDGARKFSDEMMEAQAQIDAVASRIGKDQLGKTKVNLSDQMKHFRCTLKLRVMRRKLVDYLVKNVIKPFGVPKGSEKQGGQHQGSNAPVNWPVDFVTAVAIDGKVINLVNFWKHDDISAGDDLIMYVEDRPFAEYVLSHHPKCMKKQVFPMLDSWLMPACLAGMSKEGFMCSVGEDILKRVWDMFSSFEADAQSVDGRMGRAAPMPAAPARPFVRDAPAVFTEDRTYTSADLKRKWEQQELVNKDMRNKKMIRPTVLLENGLNRVNRGIVDAEDEDEDEEEKDPYRVVAPYLNKDKAMLQGPRSSAGCMYAMLSLAHDPAQIMDFLDSVQKYHNDFKVSIGHAMLEVTRMFMKDSRVKKSYVAANDWYYTDDTDLDRIEHLNARAVPVKESIFQLVPGVSSSNSAGVRHAIWRHGYWHIARSQIMHFRYDQNLEIPNGIHAAIRGKLLEATLAPVWVEPLESGVLAGGGYGMQDGPNEASTCSAGGDGLPGGGGSSSFSSLTKDVRLTGVGMVRDEIQKLLEITDKCAKMKHQFVEMWNLSTG